MADSIMTKDRQIVLMLILRQRTAKNRILKYKNIDIDDRYRSYLWAQHAEAANAAELARRILYGHEL